MKTLTNTQTKTLLLLLVVVLLSACGAKKTVRFNQDGGNGVGGFGSMTSLAYCNTFSNGILSGNVKVYSNEMGVMLDQSLELILSDSASNLLNGSTKAIKFYKWYASRDGTTYFNPTPIEVTIKSLQTNQIVTGHWDQLSVSKIQQFITYNSLGNMTIPEFLTNFSIVLSQVELEYNVIRAVAVDNANIVSQVDFLGPAFSADPINYMSTHAAVLHALHPNYGIRQLGFTAEQYIQRLAGYCF